MSARIVPLSVLSFILLTIFAAVVATAQEAAPAAPQPLPNAPFVLAPEEQANLDRVLGDWQTMSGRVKTFQADFTRIDYDGVFGNGVDPKRVVRGQLKYAAPDKGFYDLEDKSEKWICTGDAVFEFRAEQKQVREHPLPPNMRGRAIADGPMPFVFGIEAEKMKSRYWLRITTPQHIAEKNQVQIEAYPKHAQDAANFYKIDVILAFTIEGGAVAKLEPYALNLVHPNQKDRTVYRFDAQHVNTFLNNLGDYLGVFVRPATPLGWQHQIVDDNVAAGPQPPADQPVPTQQPPLGVGAVPQATTPR